MNQKSHKTIGHVAPQRPMTEEEKQMRIMQFLQQKREQFTITILGNVVQGWNYVSTDKETAMDLVDISVKMADHLLEKLYPIKEEEKPASDEPIQTDFD